MFMFSINTRAYESTFSVTIPKEIVLDGDKKTATYSVDVKGDIQSGETAIVSVTPSTSFSLSNIVASGYPTKEAISAQVSQNVTSWTYNDIIKGATISGKITANDISAGDWSGSLNFNVKFDVNSMTINVTNGEATYDGNATNGGAKVEVVSPSNGYTITYGTTNGTYDLNEMPTYTNPGTYEVYYKIEASNYTTKTGSLTITINEGLNGYTWEKVSAICAKGEAKEYFNVGDEAVICLGEMDTMEYTYAGTLGNTTTLEKQTATIVVGDMTNTSLTLLFISYGTQAPSYQMNPQTDEYKYGTNIGGWESTILREWLNNTSEGGFYNTLSSSLKNVITTHITSYSATYDDSEVSYCMDKLWLLSEKEVYGSQTYSNVAASNVETQLAYFANGNSKIKYQTGTSGVVVDWWLRSSDSNSGHGFYVINPSSNTYGGSAFYARSVFPAFTIGQPSLNDYSWSEIQGICKLGLANEYFNVGDTKTIELGEMNSMEYWHYGTLGTTTSIDAQKATLVVADIANDSITMLFTSYNTQAPFYQMTPQANTYGGTNIGGWEATILRKWLNNTSEGGFYNALPNDLKSVIKTHSTSYSATYDTTNVSYCDDYLWLLSAKEVFGTTNTTLNNSTPSETSYENDAAFNTETQLAYFANITNGDSRIVRYKTGTSGTSIHWRLRSSSTSSNASFCHVGNSGHANSSYAFYASGVFPAFDIG
jgi:hypothetical protein